MNELDDVDVDDVAVGGEGPGGRRPTRRQASAVVAAAGVAAVLGLVASCSGGAGASGATGPAVAAEVRDLQVTDDERGTVARADATTVLYDGTGGRVGGGPAGSDVSAQAAGVATPAVLAPTPCPGATSSTTAGPTTSTTACAPGTTSSTVPPTTAPPTSAPPTTAPPTTAPPTVLVPDPGPPADGGDGDDRGGPPADAPDDEPAGSDPVLGGPSAGGDDERDGGPEGPSGSSTATLTELLAVGATATRGSVLYRADDEPIVAILGTTPVLRDLRVGVDDGADVRAVESELRELGYEGVTVDDRYDAATASAVRRWEEDLGRSAPDGVVTVGEVRVLDEPTAVLEHHATVGDLLEPGDAVVVLGAESRVVEADVEADAVAGWAVGTPVAVAWPDGTTSTGSVVELGRDVVDAQVAIVIALADGAGTEVPVGTRVDLARTVSERAGVVAVPVSAVVASDDGPALRVVGSEDDRLTRVELGVVDDGWVEVTSGIEAGTEVRLPA